MTVGPVRRASASTATTTPSTSTPIVNSTATMAPLYEPARPGPPIFTDSQRGTPSPSQRAALSWKNAASIGAVDARRGERALEATEGSRPPSAWG